MTICVSCRRCYTLRCAPLLLLASSLGASVSPSTTPTGTDGEGLVVTFKFKIYSYANIYCPLYSLQPCYLSLLSIPVLTWAEANLLALTHHLSYLLEERQLSQVKSSPHFRKKSYVISELEWLLLINKFYTTEMGSPVYNSPCPNF